MADEPKFSGITKTQFEKITRETFDGYLESTDIMLREIALGLPDTNGMKRSLQQRQTTVRNFNLLFDIMGFGSGFIGGASKGFLKLFAKELAKSLGQKFALDYLYEMSRSEFSSDTEAAGNNEPARAQAVLMINYYRACHGFIKDPMHKTALGEAASKGPIRVKAVSRFLQNHYSKIVSFSREIAGKIWDQLFHGSSMVVPKAGPLFEELVEYCRMVSLLSVNYDVLSHNYQYFGPMSGAIKNAEFRTGGKLVPDLSAFSLYKKECNQAWLDRHVAKLEHALNFLDGTDWIGDLVEK